MSYRGSPICALGEWVIPLPDYPRRPWVKVRGSEVRREHPGRLRCRLGDSALGYGLVEDQSQPALSLPCPPTLLENHGDGTFTHWLFTSWGPLGRRGRLAPGIAVARLDGEADRVQARWLNRRWALGMELQRAWREIYRLQEELKP